MLGKLEITNPNLKYMIILVSVTTMKEKAKQHCTIIIDIYKAKTKISNQQYEEFHRKCLINTKKQQIILKK